eukprot:8829598-Prorocentrum_lima.AAC.1
MVPKAVPWEDVGGDHAEDLRQAVLNGHVLRASRVFYQQRFVLVLWCAQCGAYTTNTVRALHKACNVEGLGGGFRQQRKRAHDGKFPGVGKTLSQTRLLGTVPATRSQLAWLAGALAG